MTFDVYVYDMHHNMTVNNMTKQRANKRRTNKYHYPLTVLIKTGALDLQDVTFFILKRHFTAIFTVQLTS